MMDRILLFGGIALGALIQLFLPAWPVFTWDSETLPGALAATRHKQG